MHVLMSNDLNFQIGFLFLILTPLVFVFVVLPPDVVLSRDAFFYR